MSAFYRPTLAALFVTAYFGIASHVPVYAGPGERPKLVAADSPWDVAKFLAVPEYEIIKSTKQGDAEVKELWFRGPVNTLSKEASATGYTKVFAFYGVPKVEKGKKVPALVLIHGWAGQAMMGWVREATSRGYAAMAISTNGQLGDGRAKGAPTIWPDEIRGPGDGYSGPKEAQGRSPFVVGADEPPTNVWMYHAVADVMLANSLLRSFPEVDAERIGVWGISWGGYHTCIVAGLDARFRAAVPMYGCGFLHENGAWAQNLQRMKPAERDAWVKQWDPSNYVGATKMPVLFFNGHNDSFYPLDSWTKTRQLVRSEGTRTVVSFGLGHGHIWDKRVGTVWRFLGEQLKGDEALPIISDPVIAGKQVTASVKNAKAIERAMLYYTTGPHTKNNKREWIQVPLTVDSGKLSGPAPSAEATAWFIGISDTGETKTYSNLVSSAVVLVSAVK